MLILALLAVTVHADSLTVPGISRQLAEYRAERIANVRYDLTLDVTRGDTTVGHVVIRFTRKLPGDAIVDFRGYSMSATTVNGRATALTGDGAHLRIPAAMLASGENRIEADFRSAIAPAGASIIRFHDATDGADYLYTLLVPSDANLLFPCFDQPDLKARVTLTLTTPRGWKALANGPLIGTDSTSHSDATTHRFRESDPISTYLIAFAAGPWATTSAVIDGRPISMWVRASRAKEAQADTLIATNARAIAWLETYTARLFPFQKFDFLLAPAFPFGGMEHPGAVFYNEESFIYREPPTRNQLLGREATIYHEVSHQWFGDLVTMKWFDDLWLKEGFATYIAAVMQDDLRPGAHAWRTFFLRNKPVAYATDASRGTTPVWQSLANLDQAKSNYGAIVYNKAPGILKQLDYLVGDTTFKRGLRLYLHDHAYASATWRDLLEAIQSASRSVTPHSHQDLNATSHSRQDTSVIPHSRQDTSVIPHSRQDTSVIPHSRQRVSGPAVPRAEVDLLAWGRDYILRPGMPVVTQRVVPLGTSWQLELVQSPAQPLSGPAPWSVRTQVLIGDSAGRSRVVPMLLDSTRTVRTFPGRPPAFVFANAGDEAYTITYLDSASTRWAEQHVGSIEDPLQKAMTWNALWDLVRDARLAPERFAQVALRELPHEHDDQLAPFVVGRLARAIDSYACDDVRAELLPEAERVLAAGAADSSRSYSVRKSQLDALIGLSKSPSVLAHLDAALDSASIFGLTLRAPTRWAIVTHLASLNAATARARMAAEARQDSTSEGKRRAFVAGAAWPDSAVKANYWHRYLADSTLNEDWVTASLGAFNDPDQEALTRRYLIPALDTLPWIQRNRRIFFLGSWLGSFMSGQRSADALAFVEDFLDVHEDWPHDLREKILQSEDELERTVKIRRGCRAP